ncbi:MAG: CBS domain-containing protein [Firmicutes bacterium]|nr:CBS domain-containing protein [Bacillota bacterium]
MDKKKVKDVMIPLDEYPKVYADDSLKDAIDILKSFRTAHETSRHHHRSLMVFSKTQKVGNEEKLVGLLSVRDIIAYVKKSTVSLSGVELFAAPWAQFYHKAPVQPHLAEVKVADLIRPLQEAFVQSNQDVSEALHVMMAKNVNLLPAFEGKKSVGVVRGIDLLDYILSTFGV